MIEIVTEKITKYKSPDGVLHDTPKEAEVHHLGKVLQSLMPAMAPGVLRDIAEVLIANKGEVGPLLRVPITRTRKTPEEKARIKADAEAAAKAKKEAAKKANRPGGQPA